MLKNLKKSQKKISIFKIFQNLILYHFYLES